MTLKNNLIAFVTLCIILLSSASLAGDKYYLITHGSADYYWTALFNGAKTAAKQWGVSLQIIAPEGAEDIATEVRNFETALATQPAGIASTLPSDTAFVKALTQAQAMHVAVIAIDTTPNDLSKNPILAFIGSDNLQLGQAEAEKALQQYPISKRVVIANPQPGQTGLENRALGIKSVFEKKHISVDELNTGTDPSKIQAIIQSYFVKHPDTSAIFCLTSQTLIPIAQMIKHNANLLPNKPIIASFDNTPETAHFIQQGIIQFTINQQPYLMGYFAISQLVLNNLYALEPVNINTGYGFVTKQNVDSVLPLIQKGFR